jgi:DNA-binding transcriptional ArsR family regulator
MSDVSPEVRRVAGLLATLGDPTRLMIVLQLRDSSSPVRLSEIKAGVAPEASQSGFHAMIRPLVSARLVARVRRGKEAYYWLDAEARGRLGPLLDLVTRLEPGR